ncbi:beta-N-acetylhexosaminidase isoform X1 [Conger conger]|uniref:beta-N-acetylhexosaminidase isoform X1 n=1 Tax=Conger conger TaxID=82655 RepID=UPI002A5A3982|nr:beta-N-acetylhexosaminidase isoform X1 [Conger conger]XP_061080211.1 beta-N-acetylhexosaminidase isoform X1 [Conger conger]XP_061080212.1 beta-N-acetylhexosaminidase isoform X1 [Conger conger]
MLSTRLVTLLRVVVFTLVVAVVFKLVSRPRLALPGNELSLASSIRFWNKKSEKEQEPWKQDARPVGGVAQEVKEQVESLAKVEKLQTLPPLDPNAPPLKVVHLDLKGAAPKMKYLEQIFPLFSSLGATGVLLEYEDMFPYEGDLQLLRSPYAYSAEDIKTIRNLAKLSNLQVIPLVQVFGHLEFVLKHEKYTELREVEAYPNSLNPHALGAQALIQAMVIQVMDQHPDSPWLHIGADEVFGLGESQDSKNWLNNNVGDVGKMFLNHVVAVARFIVERRPGIHLLMWDDMMRQISASTLKESGLPSLASPVIWFYAAELNLKKIDQLISKYQEVGFKDVWFASAFKGASCIYQRVTPLSKHLTNHLSWLKVMKSMSKYPSISFRGIVLTGWQRYDHFAVLCELLPVGIPSLAVCLKTLEHGAFSGKAQMEIQNLLGCSIKIEEGICKGSGAFSGSEVYNMVLKIDKELQKQTEELMNDKRVRGSFTNYHRKYNFANPRDLAFFTNKLEKLLVHWEPFLQNFRTQMETMFFPDTIEEWMDENVNEHMDKLRKMAADADQIGKLKGRPKSQ